MSGSGAIAADLAQRLGDSLARWRIPGASMAVLSGGDIIEAAAGVSNLNTGQAVTPDTLFPYGSVTKVLTATLVLHLVQQGKVQLDAPVAEYVPEFDPVTPSVKNSLTVRHLLSHSSGLPGTVFTDTGWGPDALRHNVNLINQQAHYFEPGLMLSYCNSGLLLLGRIVETVSGEHWHNAFQSLLAAPLGLDALITRPEFALRRAFAVGHLRAPGESALQVDPQPFAFASHSPAGSTPAGRARDLLAVVQLYLGSGAQQGYIGPALASEAWCTQSRPPSDLLDTTWGLGWTLFHWHDDEVVVGHNGATAGTLSFLRVHPASGTAVVLLVNSSNGMLVYDDVFTELFAELTGLREPGRPALASDFQPEVERYQAAFEDIHARVELRVEGKELRMHTLPAGNNQGISRESASVVLHNYVENGFFTDGQVSRIAPNVGAERTRLISRLALCTLDDGRQFLHDGYLAFKAVP